MSNAKIKELTQEKTKEKQSDPLDHFYLFLDSCDFGNHFVCIFQRAGGSRNHWSLCGIITYCFLGYPI